MGLGLLLKTVLSSDLDLASESLMRFQYVIVGPHYSQKHPYHLQPPNFLLPYLEMHSILQYP